MKLKYNLVIWISCFTLILFSCDSNKVLLKHSIVKDYYELPDDEFIPYLNGNLEIINNTKDTVVASGIYISPVEHESWKSTMTLYEIKNGKKKLIRYDEMDLTISFDAEPAPSLEEKVVLPGRSIVRKYDLSSWYRYFFITSNKSNGNRKSELRRGKYQIELCIYDCIYLGTDTLQKKCIKDKFKVK